MSLLFLCEFARFVVFMGFRTEESVASNNVFLPIGHDEDFRQTLVRMQFSGIVETPFKSNKRKKGKCAGDISKASGITSNTPAYFSRIPQKF